MITYLTLLLVLQINASPTPKTLGDALQVHRYGIEPGLETQSQAPFPIARYLAIASHLQSLSERERVTWLRMAAASPHLNEPAVYIARMLITSKDKPLRVIYAYVGNHAAQKPSEEFTDSPIEIYDGVPFLVAEGTNGTGLPEPSADYIEYLLANGEWRETRFVRRSNKELLQTAARYIEHLRNKGFSPSAALVQSLNAQANVPLLPTSKPH